MSIEILIGLGGNTLALLLEHAGVDFEIFERAAMIKPLGSAISLGCNILLIMRQPRVVNDIPLIGKLFPFTDFCDENRVVQNHVDVSFVKKLIRMGVVISTANNMKYYGDILHLDKVSSMNNHAFQNRCGGPRSWSRCLRNPEDLISRVIFKENVFATWFHDRTVLLDACHKKISLTKTLANWPQVAFLPRAEDTGTIKPLAQPSLTSCHKRPVSV
ncbi:MAG: hypothetical protein BYD32DRAFT_462383 [Podila humilis]|nr:MAG: hypothetical protein BYD32DRAFT_462383 [Podila humilis]